MNILYAFAFFLTFQDTPFKPNEEFEVKLNFEFRLRPHETNTYTYDGRAAKGSSAQLPYLKLNLKLNKLSLDETRIRILDKDKINILTKKTQEGLIILLDLGFTDDIKGRVASHEYTALLLDKDKNPVSRIVIFFEEDGSYLVNGEKRGKI